MPRSWQATVLLHPFSPPQSNDPNPDTPFFQLCVANVWYHATGDLIAPYFTAQITGTEHGTWWYEMYHGKTRVSRDKGATWSDASGLDWQFPNGWFGSAPPACVGTSPLNWMSGPNTEWWKFALDASNPKEPAATWMWFDSATRHPVRMMYGEGPPSPTRGSKAQLPLFQMYSFTYFPSFQAGAPQFPPSTWTDPVIAGFQVGNPNGYKPFVWNPNFGMTAFMTPVNELFNPLPTRVLYVWKPDAAYSVASDRAQDTLMLNTYHPGKEASQEALLFGPAPAGVQPPPHSDKGFLITNYNDGTRKCNNKFPFPQEPPTWISIPGVHGAIRATIANHPVLCPNTTITLYSVLFPPALPHYPDSTYLWTWYAPTPGTDGTSSRPVTFMQSQSGVGLGTSLALADYFDYQPLSTPIDPANFAVPPACSGPTESDGAR
jgi:hypothetical protein